MVYDKTIYQLKKITEHCIHTIGSTNIEIQVGGDKRVVEFHVVQPTFLVPHEGILGKPFIVGQGAIVNYQTNELTLTDRSYITLQPRTETIVAVPAQDTAENIQILVDNQKITETVTCGNCITIVRNKSISISLINPTENPIQIQIPNLD